MQLSQLSFGGEQLDKLADNRFDNPGLVHFDFAVVERLTRRVLALVEVDGMQHRFQAYKDPDTGERRTGEEAARAAQRDWEKERLVRALGGTCAWLGRPGGHQLVKAVERDGRWSFIPGDRMPDGKSAPGDENRLAGWVTCPGELSADSRFVFMRIPDDGSTVFEFDSLKRGAGLGVAKAAPTVDEFVRRQLGRGVGGKLLWLSDSQGVLDAGDSQRGKIISEIAAGIAAGMQPSKANEVLVGMGILENDASVGGKSPTQLGEFLGIALEPQRAGEVFRRVRYDKIATALVKDIL